MIEVFKDIPGFPGYQVSNLGCVKSLDRIVTRKNGRTLPVKEKIRAHSINRDGYPMVTLTLIDKRQTFTVHRLVAQAFIPNPQGKPHINHKDGDTANNCVDNLEWCTPSENVRHCVKMGNYKRNGVVNRKLSMAQANQIRSIEGFYTHQTIANFYGVSRTVIHRILNNKAYPRPKKLIENDGFVRV